MFALVTPDILEKEATAQALDVFLFKIYLSEKVENYYHQVL